MCYNSSDTTMRTGRPAQPNESVERGVSCLLELASSERAMTVSELAERLDVERTRVSRMLGTLAYLGFAERLPSRRYASGPGIHVLAALSLRTSGLLRIALPVLRRLKEEHGLDTALGVLWRSRVCYLYHSSGKASPEASIGGHELYPADVSSIGRILLAALPEAEVRTLHGEAAGLWQTPVDGLLDVLRVARRDGYATAPGASVAVTVGRPPLAGMAVVGAARGAPGARVMGLLRQAASEATERLAAETGDRGEARRRPRRRTA